MQTGKYRGFSFPNQFLGLVKHIQQVNELIDELRDLQATWGNLSLLGELTQIGADISSTRQNFQDLANKMSNSLLEQNAEKITQVIATKAQNAIDILVRNLFERTADIGFLATDQALKNTCQRYNQNQWDEDEKLAICDRLLRYISFYSVYNNVLILNPQGQLISDIQNQYPQQYSLEWIKQGIDHSTAPYFEQLARIHPNDPNEALIYAWRIQEQQTLGYVALVFNLAEESKALFDKVMNEHSPESKYLCMVCGIIDPHGVVLMSSDINHIAPGQQLKIPQDQPWAIYNCGPTPYVACARPSRGYQGYGGPGWLGFCMVPINHAFVTYNSGEQQFSIEDLNQVAQQVSPAVLQYPVQAYSIQMQLNRSVWNGNIAQHMQQQSLGETFTKTLLWEISRAGERTRTLIDDSLQNLGQTIFESAQNEQKAAAMLAIDLMDRNLYERANDCRWWALSPPLLQALQSEATPSDIQAARENLSAINALYTVYSTVLLINAEGTVICSSTTPEFDGLNIEEPWFNQAMQLRSSNHYSVSNYTPSILYNNRHAYIYCAALFKDLHLAEKPAGIVALVFDSEPQFEAILNDSLPTKQSDTFAFIVDEQKNIIASTTNRFNKHNQLTLAIELPQFHKAQSVSVPVLVNNTLYAVGICASSHYREYKNKQDCYQNNLYCIYGKAVGPHNSNPQQKVPALNFDEYRQKKSEHGSIEVATFRVNAQWLGLPSEDVIESFLPGTLASMPNSHPSVIGSVLYKGNVVVVVDTEQLCGMSRSTNYSLHQKQVVLLRSKNNEYMGLAVDQLGEIPNIPIDNIEMREEVVQENGVLGGLVQAGQGFLALLDHDKVLKTLRESKDLCI